MLLDAALHYLGAVAYLAEVAVDAPHVDTHRFGVAAAANL